MNKNEDKIKALAALSGTEEVPLPCGVTVVVEELGLRHVRKFATRVASVIPALVPAMKILEGEDDRSWLRRVTSAILPFAFTDLFDLIDDCIDVPFGSIPLDQAPAVVDAWIQKSFGSPGKFRPWADLATRVMDMFVDAADAKDKARLKQILATSSTSSSEPATTASKS